MARTFSRIVKSNPPRRDDFLANTARGRRPARSLTSTQARRWEGISVFETAEQARRHVGKRPALGGVIAEIRPPPGSLVHAERTNPSNPGHHALWGRPEDVRQRVARMITVAENDGEAERTP